MKPTKPKLSICMIIKNAEQTLQKCMDGIAPLLMWKDHESGEPLCELIVVDTGSTDASIDLAKGYATKFSKKEFVPFDFSKARNESLEGADGEWILILDSDEVVDPACLPALRDAVTNPLYDNLNTMVFSVRSFYDAENKFWTDFSQPRLFRNTGHFHYQGHIHNKPVLEQPLQFFPSVWLWHYGYKFGDEGLREEKTNRALQPLLDAFEADNTDLHALIHLTKTYKIMGDLENTRKYGMLCIEGMEKVEYHRGWFGYLECFMIMIEVHLLEGDFDGAKDIYERLIKIDKNAPEAMFLLGNHMLQKKKYTEAVEWFEAGLLRAGWGSSEVAGLMSNALKMTMPKVHNFLAIYYYKNENLKRAGQHVNAGVAIDKANHRWDVFNFEGM